MASSVIPFLAVQKFHQIVGIYPSGPNQKKCSINATNTIFLISSAQFTLTSAAFIAVSANSMIEYGFGFYTTICAVNSTVIYILYMWQLENTLNFIENCKGFIAKRKYHFEYPSTHNIILLPNPTVNVLA